VRSGETIKGLDTGWVSCVAVSPKGDLVASGGVDRVVKIWDTRSWQKLSPELSDPGCITSLVLDKETACQLAS
jgi:WD40 repeat protein